MKPQNKADSTLHPGVRNWVQTTRCYRVTTGGRDIQPDPLDVRYVTIAPNVPGGKSLRQKVTGIILSLGRGTSYRRARNGK